MEPWPSQPRQQLSLRKSFQQRPSPRHPYPGWQHSSRRPVPWQAWPLPFLRQPFWQRFFSRRQSFLQRPFSRRLPPQPQLFLCGRVSQYRGLPLCGLLFCSSLFSGKLDLSFFCFELLSGSLFLNGGLFSSGLILRSGLSASLASAFYALNFSAAAFFSTTAFSLAALFSVATVSLSAAAAFLAAACKSSDVLKL